MQVLEKQSEKKIATILKGADERGRKVQGDV